MKLNEIGTGLATFGKQLLFTAKKKSPELCVIGAIVCGAGALVMTWVAARKTDEVLYEPKKMIKTAKSMEITETYPEESKRHDITLGYVKGGVAIAKLYAPAVILASCSLGMIFGSYRILSHRNAELIAGIGVLTKEFADYRSEVVKKYGKEEDYRLRYAGKLEEVEEKTVDENGEEKVEKTMKPKKDYDQSDFGRFFDESCSDWTKDPQLNITTLRNIVSALNSKLHADHILLVNDVYEALNLEKTQAGYQWGWAYYPFQEPPYVSFGEWLYDDEIINRLIKGNERSYWLDINCTKIDFSNTQFRKV